MDNKTQLLLNVSDRSYFSLVKKDIHALGMQQGFSDERAGQLDIIVAELCSNLIKHAGHGYLLVKAIEEHGNNGVEVICIDNGPGIADIKRMMLDGTSTKHTLGHGLGALQRLSDKFDIYSQKDWGTVILSRIFQNPLACYTPKFTTEVKGLLVPKKGEKVCGDGFYYKHTNNQFKLFVGDGLGHGPDAAKAVDEAINSFKYCHEENPVEIIKYIHRTVKKTRGLVGTVVTFDFDVKEWNICGVGNILTKLSNFSQSKNYMSYNGILGHNIPGSLKEQKTPYEQGQYLILCSDGIKTKWELNNYPGIYKKDLSIVTAALYKDQTRNTDDASVVVAKINL
ncbi:ATP-binding SpoIIE family protein phosphatase [Segetibacter koreensis]|uniref:ATP-binding SpoIIE family protein phosphatase n=1 Tax=Segetibacter koreensis TaxID=398037 RepID=UPI00036F54CF|nr:ATP-binding SpoIIE family protein phosphatase [Segetibacter koreensis]